MATHTLARHLDRLQDGPGALPQGSAHTQKSYTGANRNISLGVPADHELFRIRTRPELYPDWLVTQVNEHRAALVTSVNKIAPVYDWDCHACQSAVLTHALDMRCPKCGN